MALPNVKKPDIELVKNSPKKPNWKKLVETQLEDEHEEPVDERWLVSYADMMTLLFGLFVMLYSLSMNYKSRFEGKVRQMSEKTFEGSQGGSNIGGTDVVPDELEGLRTKLEVTVAELNELKGKFAQETAGKQIIAEVPVGEDEQDRLKRELAQMKKELHDLRVRSGGVRLEAKLQSAEQLIDQLKQDKKKLQEELKKNGLTGKSGSGTNSFLALMIYWPTKNHDVDLIVEDPEGKRFDFKHRSFRDHPGSFALDTRRGPGAEIWQTDRIIPGTYKVTYSFYSNYDNPEPVTISGNISSVKGKVNFPAITLNFASEKQHQFSFKVDADGNVKILN